MIFEKNDFDNKNEDGQQLTVMIAKYTRSMPFAANEPSMGYLVDETYIRRSGDEITLKYDASQSL